MTNYTRIPLTMDFMFKNVFGSYGNEDILKAFLETILKIKITEIQIQNGELQKNNKENKLGILDIRAKVNNGTTVNIELQMNNESNLGERLLYYSSKLYSSTLKIKENYANADKTIVIALINFNYYKRPEFHIISHMKFEENTNKDELVDENYLEEKDELLTDKLEIHIIDMKRYLKKKDATGDLADWLNLILGKGDKIKMAAKKNKEIKKANDEVERLSQTKEMQELYWLEEKARFDENTRQTTAYNNGMSDGIKKGKKEGIKEGKKEKQIEIAKKMLLKNIPIETIADITELSYTEIENLKN